MAPTTSRAKHEPLPYKIKCQIQVLHQINKYKVCQIINNQELKLKNILKNVPQSTIYKIAKTPLEEEKGDKRIGNTNAGRKKKINPLDNRTIKREIAKFHQNNINFNSKDLQSACGLDGAASNLTFRRNLNKLDYFCLANRKKGILNSSNKKKEG